MKPLFLIGVAVCLFASGCDDSKNSLSDPKTAKADERLSGVWRDRSGDGDVYYHVGHAGEKFPACMMRVVWIKHSKGNVEPPENCLIFPTVIGGKSYLNVIWAKECVNNLDEKGWKADAVNSYMLLKYQFDGDKLMVNAIDEHAKAKAIENGEVKGLPSRINPNAPFTDTTENLARFVAEAGESLWDTKNPVRFERVDVGKKP